MAKHHKFGEKGEEAAREFLKLKGYSILETNWRLHPWEVDIIAEDDNVIVFVEVKTRQTDEYGHPVEFITGKKEKNLIHCADYYLQHIVTGREGRFDVITLYKKGGKFIIEHFKDAFSAIS